MTLQQNVKLGRGGLGFVVVVVDGGVWGVLCLVFGIVLSY